MSDSELQQQIARDLAQNTKDTALVKQAVMGNGVRGLDQRMTDQEKWRDEHPRVCPLAAHISGTVDTPKEGRAYSWLIAGVVFSILIGTGGLLIGVLK